MRTTLLLVAFALVWLLADAVSLNAANFSEVETLYRSGKIDEAHEIAAAEVERGVWNRRWSELLIECQLAKGQYAESFETYQAAIKRYPTSLPLRSLGIRVARYNGLPDQVALEKAFIHRYLETGQLRYATADTLIAAGRFFTNNGIDARIILKSFYDRVLESDPDNLDAHIATAELAIEKGDFKVAAEAVQKAKQHELQDARLDYLLSLALAPTDSKSSGLLLASSLQQNPSYAPALLLKAEKEIDRELYDAAESTIQAVLKLNPKDEKAFALQAVIAHVQGEYEKEKKLRAKALEHWTDNPNVDYLIGRKLSDKYRFREGAEYQRKALTFDADFIPATFQLAQDLLRLGDDDIGWQLANEVNKQDPYNVVAYNLMTLKDRTDGFETIAASSANEVTRDFSEPGEILLRMDPHERKVYGDAAAEILAEAKQVLCEKYDLQLRRPVIVEIFPKQSDFAIRTFGLPGGEGFLGVCFGHVITANSPASGGERPSNWKSVLWHEFCHVVTLTKTNNRMPRWLSEGISVYEELQRDRRWGQSMTARYREMILGDDFTPISKLSSAFLAPPSGEHLQFAYFESCLAVEFIVSQYGAESLNNILDTLGEGVPINIALAKHTDPIERLELAFAEYAQGKAKQFGGGLQFDRPEFDDETPREEIEQWAEDHPQNYWARMNLVRREMTAEAYEKAVEHLQYLVDHGAATGERGGVLELLARCYQELDQAENEQLTIGKLLDRSADALPTLMRQMGYSASKENWDAVLQLGEQALEIQPFTAAIHRGIVRASQEVERPEEAIGSLLALKELDPIDVSGLNYQLAIAYRGKGEKQQAIDHVVDALLESPRYRDALTLLTELSAPEPESLPSEESTSDENNDTESGNSAEADSKEMKSNESPESNSDSASELNADGDDSGDPADEVPKLQTESSTEQTTTDQGDEEVSE
ncbi:tetratricopeptide repeat protein [Stieleria sp. JC731]|uniref:tetratricopeptide repeat protein n=1 Tax=Stieleria sp. JC731 TaxID=2894195 RepID=UPI001E398F28|nr:tetratricopeptide repeat protein [Stieleria sp. JC731]MCC9601643.1 tetratricopeptide repeat protein [Stieleria sp. JC731]